MEAVGGKRKPLCMYANHTAGCLLKKNPNQKTATTKKSSSSCKYNRKTIKIIKTGD